jgi:hypothetical protein
MNSKFKFLTIALLFFSLLQMFLLSSCKQKEDLSSFKHSIRDDVDLYLIPEKFNILESEWVNLKGIGTYLKSDLIRHLKSYGRTLSDLQNDPDLQYSEKDDVVTLHIKKTSHSTYYPYDTNIPIIFHGEKWFKKGENSEVINQQHIVPTLAKIMKVRNPNGVETSPLVNILKKPNSTEKPDVIVTIVIDQGGQQYYKAHPEVPKNIEDIKKNSTYFPNARVGHVDAHTAVGHSAIGTGAYPSKSSVIGNTFFRLEEGGKVSKSEIYATSETEVNTEELKTETFADILDFENGNQSEVISQCYALRAAIGMAGHGSLQIKNGTYSGDKDFVYWLGHKEGSWVTDSRYYTLPAVVSQFNTYDNYIKDYPNGWRHFGKPKKEELSNIWNEIMATPAQVRMEGETFRAVFQSQIINSGKSKDGYTDLAFVTLKGTDAAGHGFGWESIEAKEVFAETDRQIGEIYAMLKNHYGENFILIITADHGCAPLPEISGGSRFTVNEMFKEINSLLPAGNTGNLINFMTVGQISLNHALMKENNITEEMIREKILKIKVKEKPFFKDVIYKKDLVGLNNNE